jgi:hypothetical protein
VKNYSLAAAKLYEQIMGIVGRYHDVKGAGEVQHGERDCEENMKRESAMSEDLGYGEGNLVYLDLVQWDDLFSGTSSSSSSSFF